MAGSCIGLRSRLPTSCSGPTVTRGLNETCFIHLQDEQEEEVCVCYFLELLKQVDRQKGDDVVLGGHDAVVLEEDEREISMFQIFSHL